MTSTGSGDKAAQAAALTYARGALKGLGASEMSGGTSTKRATASSKVGARSKSALSVTRRRLRRIRVRV